MRMRTLVLLLGVAALSAGACAGTDSGDSEAASAGISAEEPGGLVDPDSGADDAVGLDSAKGGGAGAGGGAAARPRGLVAPRGGESSSLGGLTAPEVGPSVIKTAALEIGVGRRAVDEAVSDAVALAARLGGFVVSSARDDDGRTPSAIVVLRVPSIRFEDALSSLGEIGDVRAEKVTGDDVGQEFVDLEARLRNWRAQESVLLELFDEATSVVDTIRIQNELSQVQLEIERIRGRLAFLEDQTSLATITARFTTSAAAGASDDPNRFVVAWRRAVDVMASMLAGGIVGLGVILPLTALALVAWAIVRGLRLRTTT